MTKCDGGLVTFGDDGTSKVVEKDNIRFQGLPNLTDVLLVEDLKTNLINISQLCDARHQV